MVPAIPKPNVENTNKMSAILLKFPMFWKTFSWVFKEDLFYFFKRKFFKILIFSYTFYLIVLYLADIKYLKKIIGNLVQPNAKQICH